MNLLEVETIKHKKEFLNVARTLYRDDLNWICPPDFEIESIFNPRQNDKLVDGKAKRWILIADDGETPIGRIAAFIDTDYFNKYEQFTGGIGFFECIDDNRAAKILFDVAKEWLLFCGMKAMDGPVNLGTNENYWGLLVDGFTPPSYGMPYQKKYYQRLFEDYGFDLAYKQFSYSIDLKTPLSVQITKVAQWITKKSDFSVKTFSFRRKKQFVHDFIEIYNKTWPEFKKDFIPITVAEVDKMFERAKSAIIEDLILFAYHKNVPIAFYVNLPDINQIIGDFKGQLTIINKLKYFYRFNFTKQINRFRGIIYGVVPKFQRSGVDALMISKMKQIVDKYSQFTECELSWVGDFNPRMIRFSENFSTKLVKCYHTYRYIF